MFVSKLTETNIHSRVCACHSSTARAKMFTAILFAVDAHEIPECYLGEQPTDSLFEMGDGTRVVAKFLVLYQQSKDLQRVVTKYDHYIGIANWLARHDRLV